MMNTSRWKHCGIVAFTLIIMFVSSGSWAIAEAASSEPEKLKVLLLPILSFSTLFIAEEEGYFAEQGLEVEFTRMQTSAQAIPALLAGDLDVMPTGVRVSMLNAISRGEQVKIVAEGNYVPASGCDINALLVKKDRLQDGKFVRSEPGKKLQVGVVMRTILQYYVEKALESAGFQPDDYEIKDMPPPVLAESVKKGALDIAWSGEPLLTLALRDKTLVPWQPITEIVPNLQGGVILYGPNLLTKNPDAGKRFMVAYLKALNQFREGKTARNIELVAKFTKMAPELVQQLCWPNVSEDGSINTDNILEYQAWTVEKGWLDRVVPVEEFWDDQFIQHANEILGQSVQ